MRTLLLGFALVLFGTTAFAAPRPEIGADAPDFKAVDSTGATQTLSQYKGKTVVLEWNNPQCPFVRKHYGAGNMQKQQEEATAAGVVWLTVNSNAKGKEGFVEAAGAKEFVEKNGAHPTAYLLDSEGSVGKLYGARTTPHLFVIDAQGKLRYMGGIDSIASSDPEDIGKATQYVRQALAELKAGKPVSTTKSMPYGCSVKYGS
jgi:peroxiredoxin